VVAEGKKNFIDRVIDTTEDVTSTLARNLDPFDADPKELFKDLKKDAGLGGGEEAPVESVLAPGSGESDVQKRKKALAENLRRNATGIRQQSVLNPLR